MVHENITAADLFKNIAARRQTRDLLWPGVTVFAQPLKSVEAVQFHQKCQIQRSFDLKDFLLGYGEFFFQEIEEPGIHAVLHFQADGIASLPLLELFFNLLEQVGGVVFIDREVRVAGDTIGIGTHNIIVEEKAVQMMADDFLQEDHTAVF